MKATLQKSSLYVCVLAVSLAHGAVAQSYAPAPTYGTAQTGAGAQCGYPAVAANAQATAGSYAKPAAFAAPHSAVRVRKSARRLTPAEAARLQQAYAKMAALPATDPRSLTAQGNAHCFYCAGGDGSNVHHSWLFFAWHRAFLYFHERILASLINEPSFALPYWDWELDGSIPHAYLAGGAAHSPRRPLGRSLSTEDMRTMATREEALSNGSYFVGTATRAGEPETQVHGFGHSFVGGDMSTLQRSARDPLFYAHHSNLDRLWTEWRSMPGHSDPADAAWLNKTWRFADADGRWVQIAVRDVIDPEKSLHYKYEHPAAPKAKAKGGLPPRKSAVVANVAPVVVQLTAGGALTKAPATHRAPLPETAKARMAAAHQKQLAGSVLHIEGISVPMHREAFVRVFLNRPDASVKRPLADVHFVGHITMPAILAGYEERPKGYEELPKGYEEQHAHGAFSVAFELPRALQAQLHKSAALDLTLVPVTPLGQAAADMQFKYGRAYVAAH